MASCRAINSPRIIPFQLTPRGLRFRAWRAKSASLVYRSGPALLRVRWRLALFRPARLLRRSLQWRHLRPLLDADADRADLELRLIEPLLKDRVRVPATAAHGARLTIVARALSEERSARPQDDRVKFGIVVRQNNQRTALERSGKADQRGPPDPKRARLGTRIRAAASSHRPCGVFIDWIVQQFSISGANK